MTQRQHIAVLGAGESGLGAALLAQKLGHEVLVSDSGTIKPKFLEELEREQLRYEQGRHSRDWILGADIIVKSPGIPDEVPLVLEARKKGIRVISEIEWGFRHSKGQMVGITGTNGKTTTTALTHYVLTQGGLKAGLGGNIGKSLARLVAEGDLPWYVLELSSFQLDGIEQYHNHIGILLNITPDHMDRYHNDLREYVRSKFRITLNQTKDDYFIYNWDDPIIRQEVQRGDYAAQMLPMSLNEQLERGAWADEHQIHIKMDEKEEFKMSMEDIILKGRHNRYNSMAAAMTGKLLEVRKKNIRESLRSFQNYEHRLEFVAKIHDVEYINDSKATNVNAAWFALESMRNPVVWIAGGKGENNNYQELKPLVQKKVKAIVLLGKDVEAIREAFQDDVQVIVDTKTMSDAVAEAARLASNGETVLLSPACKSFDLFENYEDRGRQFKEAVKAL